MVQRLPDWSAVLFQSVPRCEHQGGQGQHTLCSSCLTSCTVPSLNVQRMRSVSGDDDLTSSDLERADQKVEKFWSLMWCQTCERCAGIRLDSVTEVVVGMELLLDILCSGIGR